MCVSNFKVSQGYGEIIDILSFNLKEQGIFWNSFQGTKDICITKGNFVEYVLGTMKLLIGNRGGKVKFSRDQENMMFASPNLPPTHPLPLGGPPFSK